MHSAFTKNSYPKSNILNLLLLKQFEDEEVIYWNTNETIIITWT